MPVEEANYRKTRATLILPAARRRRARRGGMNGGARRGAALIVILFVGLAVAPIVAQGGFAATELAMAFVDQAP